MKLLKIGSESVCDVVVDSELVSDHHADITILDTGEIFIVDKGSRAGTFVGSQRRRIKPGEEVAVYRGETIRFADKELDWTKIPMPENNSSYRSVMNIGSNFRNDIVIDHTSVSPYHAIIKIDKEGRVWLIDNKSEEGTEVNGVKIATRRPIQIKKDDIIVIGDYDASGDIRSYISRRSRWLKIAVAAVFGLLAAVAGWMVYLHFNTGRTVNAVVRVCHTFNYVATLRDNPYEIPLVYDSETYDAYGTAFFIDNDGRMGTSLSVARPWLAEFSPKLYDKVRNAWKEYLTSCVPDSITSMEELEQFGITPVGMAVISGVADKVPATEKLSRVNDVLKKIHKSKVIITGRTHSMYVGYSGRKYEHIEDLDRATVVAVPETTDKDVAILQLDSKRTPESAADNYFKIKEAYTGRLAPQKETLITEGFAYKVAANHTFGSGTVNPVVIQTKVAKEPSRYTFELQGYYVDYGMCGAPVFTKRNVLVGIMSLGNTKGAIDNIAVHARYLKELYDKTVD